MAHDYETSKKTAVRIITILAIITIAEVTFTLLGKGYIFESVEFWPPIIALVMIIMSIVKAYFIVYEFMHMKYEVPALAKTVLLPTLLLLWAIAAFLFEGKYWNVRHDEVKQKMEAAPIQSTTETGMIYDLNQE